MRATELGYTFPSAPSPALRTPAFSVEPGEIVLVTGPTGSGKSTLLRLLTGILQRQGAGVVTGRVLFGERDVAALDPDERVRALGFVGQEPHDQVLTGRVGDEVAFALESSDLPLDDAEGRIEALLELVGLDYPPERSTAHLSGGELQRLEVAAALSADADALLLDEPLAHLDAEGTERLMRVLQDLARRGRRIVVAEHRLEASLAVATRIVVLDRGAIVLDVPTDEVRAGSDAVVFFRKLGLQIPAELDLADRIRREERTTPESAEPAVQARGRTLVGVGDLRLRRGASVVLKGLTLAVCAGERVALVGPNGAGKSTLLEVLAGWLPGAVDRRGRVVLVPQDPDLALVSPTVGEELGLAPRELGITVDVDRLAEALDLDAFLALPPQGLSRGQRQRVAVAAAIAAMPNVLLLDEPTTGQDRAQVERLLRSLPTLLPPQSALVFATHDLDLALRLATRVLVLETGILEFDGTPKDAVAWLAMNGTPLPASIRACLNRGFEPMSMAALSARLQQAPRGAP